MTEFKSGRFFSKAAPKLAGTPKIGEQVLENADKKARGTKAKSLH